MRLGLESKKTVSQFLNGVAVAAVSATILTPLASGTLTTATAIVGAMVAALTHAAAVRLGERR